MVTINIEKADKSLTYITSTIDDAILFLEKMKEGDKHD